MKTLKLQMNISQRLEFSDENVNRTKADMDASKKALSVSKAYPTSFAPAVSYAECIANCGNPMSTAFILTTVFERFPRVEPPAISLLFAKV